MWAELFQVLLVLLLLVAGIHRFFLLFQSILAEDPAIPDPLELTEHLPKVLIQIPVFNDASSLVAQLQRLHRIDYLRSALEIQILDDSDDGTAEGNRIAVEGIADLGVPVVHLCRDRRVGFKAGALSEGLIRSKAEFVAVFDVDFEIPEQFLLKTLAHFQAPRMGWVQCRWGYLNRTQNWLTRAQARLLDGHFRIEHRARSSARRFFNFNGTAGIWRRRAIEEAGGWSGETVVEDTDLSLRAWQGGWQGIYRDDIVCRGLLPDSFSAFRTQQRRWLAGGMQLMLKPENWDLAADPVERFDLAGRFLAPLTSLVVVLLTLWAPLRRIFADQLGPDPWVFRWLGTATFDGLFLFFALVSVVLFYASTGGGRMTRWWESILVLFLGTGFAFFSAISCCAGILGQVTIFERTPKDGGASGGRSMTGLERVMIPILVLLVWGVLEVGAWSVLPLVLMSLVGLLWSSVESRKPQG